MIEIIPNWHPVFVHFTVALLLMSAVFYVMSFLLSNGRASLFLQVSRVNLFTGVVLTVATVIAGFYAYNSVQHDDPSHAAMTDHRNWALATAALWGVAGLWEAWRSWRRYGRSLLVASVLVVASVLLAVTGFKGGELVFRYGLGVQSLPNTDDHQHPGGTSASHPREGSSDGHSHQTALEAGPGPGSTEMEHSHRGHDGHTTSPAPDAGTSATHIHRDGSSHTH